MNHLPTDTNKSASPVFVLGCAWRCGSTLLQRLISSSKEVLIWGEQNGFLYKLMSIGDWLEEIRPLTENQRADYERNGFGTWIANLNPSPDLYTTNVVRAFFEAYYSQETQTLGFTRWGFKEVRYDFKSAQFLLKAFPDARVLFLIRPLHEVLASNAVSDFYDCAGGAAGVTDLWVENTESFLENPDERVLLVNYADLASGSKQVLDSVCSHARLGNPIDLSLLDTKVRGAYSPPRLSQSELDQLSRTDVLKLSEKLDRQFGEYLFH